MHDNNWRGRAHGHLVPAKSSGAILVSAMEIRRACELQNDFFFPIAKFYEFIPHFIPGARFEILYREELGNDHGRTFPDAGLIQLREDVYEGACENKPRDRFTLAHELGHLLLHRGMSLARIDPADPPPIYRNSEWQADKFASYLLIPPHLVGNCSSLHDVVAKFVVSYEAANARRTEIQKATSGNS